MDIESHARGESLKESVFPVCYQGAFGEESNKDLKGEGTLAILHDGDRVHAFRFTGKRRHLVGTGPVCELTFPEAALFNVVRQGGSLRFFSSPGIPGVTGQPFVFYCRDEQTAAKLLEVFPARCDDGFLERLDFSGKLAQLDGASHPMLTVTNLLILTNLVVFVVMAGFLGAGWVEASHIKPYILYGANNGAATTGGEWWRLLTSQFMHFGLMHVGFNMWALYQGGHFLERLQGRASYLAIYLGSGVCGGLLSILWHGDKMWSAGASGAIFGLFGCLLGYLLREKQSLAKQVYQPMLKSTLTFAGYNLVFGLLYPGIDNAAHIGGFISGIVLGWAGAMPLDEGPRRQVWASRFGAMLLAGLVLIGAGVAFTPRFGYDVREELLWEQTLGSFTQKEEAFSLKLKKEEAQWIERRDNANALETLLKEEMRPLYASFAESLRGLSLTPGKQTAKRRELLVQFADLKLQACEHLLLAVKKDDAHEFQKYVDAEKKASAMITSFNTATR